MEEDDLPFSPKFVRAHVPAKYASESWALPILGCVFASMVATYFASVLGIWVGLRGALHLRRVRSSQRMSYVLRSLSTLAKLVFLASVGAVLLLAVEMLRYNLGRIRDFARRARLVHEEAVRAVQSGTFTLILRDFDDELMYDHSGFFIGLDINLRRDVFACIADKSRAEGLATVTLANPHRVHALEHTGTGVSHLVLDPFAWETSVERLVRQATWIVVLLPPTPGRGLSLELTTILEQGRVAHTLGIVIGDDDPRPNSWPSSLRIFDHHDFVASPHPLPALIKGLDPPTN